MGPPPPEPGPAGRGTLVGGRYRLERPLATGGMARVWMAHDEVLNRPVAVKILLDHLLTDASFVTRFRAEALAAARLAHPTVVSVYDTISQDGVEAIVMELVDGVTLRKRLDDEGRLEPTEAARIAARVADALAVAHRAGIVHRDIKPANVLLSPSGRVVVTDFGIAKASESSDLTRDHQMIGTAKYLSPEQVESRPVDGRSDLYALGVVLYEMVCGKVPFAGDSELTTALARLHGDPVAPSALRPDLPADLDRVLMRTLARDPSQRWPDAPSLVRTLTAISTGRPVPPDPVAHPASSRPAVATTAAGSPGLTTAPIDLITSPPVPPTHPPGSPPLAAAAPGPGPSVASRPRRTVAVLVAIIVGTSLIVIGALAWLVVRSNGTETIQSTATAFDPFGGDGENDDVAALATDGDPDTVWSTEGYRDRDIYKGGVGLLLDSGEQRTLEQFHVQSASTGWNAEVYVLDGEPEPDQSSWGEAVDSSRDIDGDVTFDVDGRQGRFVILWITRTAADGTVDVAEAHIEVRS